jgi:hypothetical protein
MGIEAFDYFGTPPKFFIQKKEKHSTKFGGIVSILTFTAMCSISLIFVSIFLQDKEFSVIYNQISRRSSIDLSEFPLMVNVAGPTAPIENQNITYNIVLQRRGFDYINNSKFLVAEEILLEPCNIEKHFGKYKSYFMSFLDGIENFYCYTPNSRNLTLYGIYGDADSFVYLNLYINKCVNNTKQMQGVICANSTYIDAQLQNAFFRIISLDYDIINENVNSPNKLYVRSDSYGISSSIYKRYFIYKKAVQYWSDNGLVFKDNKALNFFQQKGDASANVDFRSSGVYPGVFAEFSIPIYDKIDYYQRNFPKIQNLLANIGGYMNTILILGKLLLSYIKNTVYYLDLYNSVDSEFDIKVQRDESLTILNKHKNINNLNIEKTIQQVSNFNQTVIGSKK